jgi:3-phosphoshikimate 1-carboxyvinyltransferase
MKIQPANSMRGTIRLPGDKSISHRSGMLAALAIGDTRIGNFASSADCESTLGCLESLGVRISREGSTVKIGGVGKRGFQPPSEPLDCGNSGTTMRLLAGILAGQSFDSVLTGDESLCRRPMNRIVEPLRRTGARIETENGHPPLKISASDGLSAVDHRMQVASAQVKSCLLLAGLNANGRTAVLEPTATRDHTERMLRWFGAEVEEVVTEEGKRISIDGDQILIANDIEVPGDVSSAAFFLAAAACLPDSELTLENVGLNPSRTAILEVLIRLGANIQVANQRDVCNEPVGDIQVGGGLNTAGRDGSNIIKGKIIANLIDEIPVLAILGTQLENGLEIRGAGELRVKESDRIASVVKNLRAMNAKVEEFPDGFRVSRSALAGAKIDSFGDHRIAMAFGIAGLLAGGETEIEGAECAGVSYPEFYETLAGVIV